MDQYCPNDCRTGFQGNASALQIAPLFHVAAFHVVALPVLFAGGSNIAIEKYDPEKVTGWIENQAATTVLGAPTHFELWSATGQELAKPQRGRCAT